MGLLAVSLGCTAFREGKLASVDVWPPPAHRPKQAINVEVCGNVMGRLQATWAKQAVHALQDSGLFSEVTASSRTDATLHARVHVSYRNEPHHGMQWLSELTFFVVPLPIGSGSFDVHTTFLAGDTIAGHFTRSESYTVWTGMLGVFLVPFGSTESGTFYDAMRSTIVEATERGIL
jgi:hypothetical protein